MAASVATKTFVRGSESGGGIFSRQHLDSSLVTSRPSSLKMPSSSSRSRWRQCAVAVMAEANDSRAIWAPPSVYSSRDDYKFGYFDDRSQSAAAAEAAALCSREEAKKGRITPEKLDQWIKDSVGEIVRNIGEAPFLVHIFSNGPLLRLEKEEALPESWPSIKKRWDQGKCTPPDGIILVEELKDEDQIVTGAEEEGRKSWGLVVQGKGMDCASCYILNTCRVRSTMGFCTHFCLLRATCFGDPLEKQIKKAWLN